MKVTFEAGVDDDGRRLESVLRRLLPRQSLGTLQKALRRGDIRLNGAKAAPDARVARGDVLTVWDVLIAAPPAEGPTPPLPPSWVVHEGVDLVVVNKPSGLLVHPGDTDAPGPTLDRMVRGWLQPSAPPSLSFRPGPLHRLDRETSGLVVCSRTLVGARAFSEALAGHRVTKEYLAVVVGRFEGERRVDLALARDQNSRTSTASADGDEADSRFVALATTGALTLVRVWLGTGRTHQIRVHAQALGHPLAGDAKYGGGSTPTGLDVPWLLHAWRLKSPLLPPLEAPLPPNRLGWLEKTFKVSLKTADAVH